MKKLALLLVFGVLLSPAVCAQSIEFNVLSEVKLQTDNSVKNSKVLTPSIKTFLSTVEQINKNGGKFNVFCGDNIHKADKYSLVMFSKILRKLKKPSYVVVGEKDVAQTKGLDKKEYYRILNLFSKNKVKNLPYKKEIDDFVFLFVDGVNQFIPSQFGYYKENQLAWLEIMLEENKNKPVIIVQHYPIEAFENISDKKLPYKKEDYQKIISKYENIIAIISGHHGIEAEFEKDNVNYIFMPSLNESGEYKKIKIDYDEDSKKAFVKTRIYKVLGE